MLLPPPPKIVGIRQFVSKARAQNAPPVTSPGTFPKPALWGRKQERASEPSHAIPTGGSNEIGNPTISVISTGNDRRPTCLLTGFLPDGGFFARATLNFSRYSYQRLDGK